MTDTPVPLTSAEIAARQDVAAELREEERMAELTRRGYFDPEPARILVFGGPGGFRYFGPVDGPEDMESDEIQARLPGESWWICDLEPWDEDEVDPGPNACDFPVVWGTDATATLHVQFTDEGIIADVIQDGEVVGTWGATAQEIVENHVG